MSAVRKGYSDGPFGQLHWRMAGETGAEPDLYCLHPAPFSGLAFTAILPHLARERRVFAPDYPGHGGSDAFRADAAIADYARAMATLIDAQSGSDPVDLFGFHTGCLVACELAVACPEKVGRLVLADVPAFDAETRAELVSSNAGPPAFTPELGSLEPAWERGITRRIESQGMVRSFQMFVEQLRHGEAMNAGFHAGFSYDVEGRLSQVEHPTTIIASQSALLDATRRSAKLMPTATLVERLDITRAVLDEAAKQTAAEVLRALV